MYRSWLRHLDESLQFKHVVASHVSNMPPHIWTWSLQNVGPHIITSRRMSKSQSFTKHAALRYNIHCMKSVQIRSYFWFVFSLNAGKYGPQITLHLDTFHAVILRHIWNFRPNFSNIWQYVWSSKWRSNVLNCHGIIMKTSS